MQIQFSRGKQEALNKLSKSSFMVCPLCLLFIAGFQSHPESCFLSHNVPLTTLHYSVGTELAD